MSAETPAPDAYLILKRGIDLAGLPVVGRGFVLVPVWRTTTGLIGDGSIQLPLDPRLRFLYPEDVERLKARGEVAQQAASFHGQRIPDLARYVQLFARDVRSRHVVVLETHIAYPASEGAEGMAKAAKRPPLRRPKASLSGSTRSKAVDAIPEVDTTLGLGPEQTTIGLEEHSPSRHEVRDDAPHVPAADSVSEADDDPPPDAEPAVTDEAARDGAAEAMGRAKAAMEAGSVPDEHDLRLIATDQVRMEELTESSASLSVEREFAFGEQVLFALMSPVSETRERLLALATTISERLRPDAATLAKYLHHWASFDAGAAHGPLLRGLDAGPLAINQRVPVRVAEILRDTATATGDTERLVRAYEALSVKADVSTAAQLIGEIAQVDDVILTDGRKRTLEGSILMKVFPRAKSVDLILIGQHAERLIREMVRASPPEIDRASSLEVIVERAFDSANGDPDTQDAFQDVLRELAEARGHERDRYRELPLDTVTTYVEALRAISARSDNVLVADEAYRSAEAWSRDGNHHLQQVVNALVAVVVVADRLNGAGLGPGGLPQAFEDAGVTIIGDQSDTAKTARQSKGWHRVHVDGREYTVGPHIQFGNDKRLYLSHDKLRRCLVVGWLGDHLPGAKSKSRPRK